MLNAETVDQVYCLTRSDLDQRGLLELWVLGLVELSLPHYRLSVDAQNLWVENVFHVDLDVFCVLIDPYHLILLITQLLETQVLPFIWRPELVLMQKVLFYLQALL